MKPHSDLTQNPEAGERPNDDVEEHDPIDVTAEGSFRFANAQSRRTRQYQQKDRRRGEGWTLPKEERIEPAEAGPRICRLRPGRDTHILFAHRVRAGQMMLRGWRPADFPRSGAAPKNQDPPRRRLVVDYCPSPASTAGMVFNKILQSSSTLHFSM